jgi:RNA polymerase sigma-70 factor (ECF subfamily)
LRNLGSYRGGASLRTWLFAIAINVCRGRLRRRRSWLRMQTVLLGKWLGEEQSVQPEAISAQREQADMVWRAVQDLGEKHRLPVILRYYHDLPVAEIAGVLGISEGTVHSRLSIARDRLRGALQPAPAGHPEVEPRWQR